MSRTPNELVEFFPGQDEAIDALKASNAHFAKLVDAYDEANRAVRKAETDLEPTDDFHEEGLRKRRLQLLDEIKTMLRTAG